MFTSTNCVQKTITSFFTSPSKKAAKCKDDGKESPIDRDSAERKDVQSNTDDESPVKKNTTKKRPRKLIDSDEEDEEKNEEKPKGKKTKAIDDGKSPEDLKVSKVTKTYKSKGNVTTKQESRESNKSDEEDSSPSEKAEEPKSQKTKISSFFVPVRSGKTAKNADMSDSKPEQITKCDDTSSGYNPSETKYHLVESAIWKHGERVPYLALAKSLEVIEAISGRLKMIEILANFFRSVIVLSPDDLLHCVYLCLNQLAPAYENVELGVGDNVLMKAIAQATGRNMASLKSEIATKGDIGIVAESSRSNQRMMMKPAPLTVRKVFEELTKIAVMSGHSSMAKKTEKIQSLLVACRQCEARYLARSLSGKLRVGLAEQSLLAALAQAVTLTPPAQGFPPEILDASKGVPADTFKKKLDDHALKLKTAYCECPNYGRIISVLLSDGIELLNEKCTIVPGIPLKPMLAHPTKGIEEVCQRFEKAKFTCEYKYDGERAQIHGCDDGSVKIFSRNQENNTSKYPDIIARIPKVLSDETKTFILDAEAVAWDQEKGHILPFQVLSTRKRKDAKEADLKVQVCIFAFDLLYLNGKSLVQERLETRRQHLISSFKEQDGEFMFAKSMESGNLEDIQAFLDESVKGKCEGLMVKSLDVDATYEIAKRSRNWLKLKKDYLDGVGDTLDLVVVGGYFGKGKRTGNYGGFLLACYDPDNEEYQTICKIGTGFKDEDFAQHSTFLKQHVVKSAKSYYRFDANVVPDEWFEPCQVWEVKCADLSVSPVHKAAMGIVDPEKGVSLRFPRYLRIRDDKKPEDATTSEQVADLYRSQEQIKSGRQNRSNNEEDFY